MYPGLSRTIAGIQDRNIPAERRTVLRELSAFIQSKADAGQDIRLSFICTHNSRRSQLAQVWAQAAAAYSGVPDVYCYSGGTEVTALHPVVAETLDRQGFRVLRIAGTGNAVYAFKYSANSPAVIGFSKKYYDPINPRSAFAAVMTCSQADAGCPFITGAEKRIALPFEDPGMADHTPEQARVYAERSLQIAAEMFYVFSMIKK